VRQAREGRQRLGEVVWGEVSNGSGVRREVGCTI